MCSLETKNLSATLRSILTTLLILIVFVSVGQANEISFKNVKVQPTSFLVSKGRVLFTQIVKPTRADAVTFLFLPGVNRSVLVEEDTVQALIAKGYGAVTFNFSTQPLSLALLAPIERPYFRDNELTLKDFAEETEALARRLRSDYGMAKIIPVSLSYSGAVSLYLKDFPLVIETAPMTSNAAANPQAEAFRQSVIASQIFNPFFGPTIVRTTMDNVYRANWSQQVSALAQQFGFVETPDMVEGYTMMSRAAEAFSWQTAGVEVQGRRVFLVAENEAEALKQDQLKTFDNLDLTNELIVIKNSGHVIPFDQPGVYAETLDKIVSEYFSPK